jgi:hypothetical protein
MFWLNLILSQALASGGEKPAEAVKVDPKQAVYSGAQTDEWSKAQKDLQTAKIKYENDVKTLEELKHSAEMQENLSKDSLAKINEATKTVKTSEANYLRFLNQYNLRFPEKGLNVGRKYERSGPEREGLESVEEKPQGVEAKLRKLNRNIKRQYLSTEVASATSGSAKKAPFKKQSSDESGETSPNKTSGDVTDTITIEK